MRPSQKDLRCICLEQWITALSPAFLLHITWTYKTQNCSLLYFLSIDPALVYPCIPPVSKDIDVYSSEDVHIYICTYLHTICTLLCYVGYILHQQLCGQQDQGSDIPLSEVTPQILCLVLIPSLKEDVMLLEHVQRWAKEVGKGLEHKTGEEQLRQLGMFRAGEKEAEGGRYCSLQLPESRL